MFINSYIAEYSLFRADTLVGLQKTFTYVNESLNHYSRLDHLPIIIVCKCDRSPAVSPAKGVTILQPAFLRWDHADTCQYYHLTGVDLQIISYKRV